MTYRIAADLLRYRGEWVHDRTVTVTDGVIVSVTQGLPSGSDVRHVPCLVPGVIDNHMHGGFGFAATEADADGMEAFLSRLGGMHVRGAVLGLYGSTEEIRRGLAAADEVMKRQKNARIPGSARLLGVHLEGPFLSPERPGAMKPEHLRKPTVPAYRALVSGYEDLIREMTLAPEEDDGFALTSYLRSVGVRVLAGHTDCDYDTAVGAFSAGVGAVCHTFNASRPIRHRDPGILTAALTDPDIFCECIGDTIHLHPGILRLLALCKRNGRLMLISDAVSTAGYPDGEYTENGWTVIVRGGACYLPDGTLNGGGCYTPYAVGRLVKAGIPLETAVLAASETPAAWLGLSDWRIDVGCPACLNAFASDGTPIALPET